MREVCLTWEKRTISSEVTAIREGARLLWGLLAWGSSADILCTRSRVNAFPNTARHAHFANIFFESPFPQWIYTRPHGRVNRKVKIHI